MDSTTVTDLDRSEAPAVEHLTPVQWARKNLFSSVGDTIVTLVTGSVIVWVVTGLLRTLLASDFTILRVNLALFMVGSYPRDQLWRPSVAIVLVAVMFGFAAGAAATSAENSAKETGVEHRMSSPADVLHRFWPLLALVAVLLSLTSTVTPTLVVAAAAAAGIVAYLAGRRAPARLRKRSWVVVIALIAAAYLVLTAGEGGVAPEGWGGLQINLFLTIAGILLAFPLGLLLALGRRSSLPTVRLISVTYIEFIRGVPLITLLLMGIFALGFFVPSGLRPDDVTRVLIAITLFEAAYIAEVVRGGLQSVPKGQTEAAQALGVSPWRTMRLVVLPQALRATIPAMVGQFISLFKDTSLVAIVGIADILRASSLANSQSEFLAQGLDRLTLPFVGLVFWVGSYTMSREAGRLERKLGVGER